jgi:histidyl-tRNA synthetase
MGSQETSTSIIELPLNVQTSTAPKRQRSASQRSQQQRVRLQKQRESELLKAKEQREYLVKYMHLRRTVRALVFVSFIFDRNLIRKIDYYTINFRKMELWPMKWHV